MNILCLQSILYMQSCILVYLWYSIHTVIHSLANTLTQVLIWFLFNGWLGWWFEMTLGEAWRNRPGMAATLPSMAYLLDTVSFVYLQSNTGGQQIHVTRVFVSLSPLPHMRRDGIAHPYRVISFGDACWRCVCKSRRRSDALWKRWCCWWDACRCDNYIAALLMHIWRFLGRCSGGRSLLRDFIFECAQNTFPVFPNGCNCWAGKSQSSTHIRLAAPALYFSNDVQLLLSCESQSLAALERSRHVILPLPQTRWCFKDYSHKIFKILKQDFISSSKASAGKTHLINCSPRK